MSCTLSSSVQVIVLVYSPLGFEEVIRILVSGSIICPPCVIDFFFLLNIFFVNALYPALIIYIPSSKIILLSYCLDFALSFVYLVVIIYMQVAFL